MVVFSCAPNWESMLTCIYYAWTSRIGHQNIRLELEPIEQMSFLDEYRHIDADIDKAESVMLAVKNKISPYFYHQLAYCSMAYESDILDVLYHVMMLGFKYGTDSLKMYQFRDVMRYQEIHKRLSNEVCRFKEVVRFHEIQKKLYVAHLEPKSRIVMSLGPVFMDRMPSEHWMIVDDVHREAIIHPKDEMFYMKGLSDFEFERLKETEEENDGYTDLWKVFFDSIAIKERTNPKCQMSHMPLWARKHAVEFL